MLHKQIITTHGNVHYWIHQNKNPNSDCIVFTHGVTGSHIMFEKQSDYFSEDYTIITWDMPMHGLSKSCNKYSFKYNAEILNKILSQESIYDAILVGMSNGGYTTQMFGHLYPDKVKSMIAIDTTPLGLSYYSKNDIRKYNLFTPMMKLMPDTLLRHMMAKGSSITAYGYQLMKTMHDQLSKSDIINLAGIAYQCLLTENVDVSFEFPVLILYGEYDKGLSVNKYCQKWAKSTGYPVEIIRNAGHLSNIDNFHQVNDAIKNFIIGESMTSNL